MGPIGGEMRGADEAEHGAGGNGPLRQSQTRTLSLDRVAVLVKRPWERVSVPSGQSHERGNVRWTRQGWREPSAGDRADASPGSHFDGASCR